MGGGEGEGVCVGGGEGVCLGGGVEGVGGMRGVCGGLGVGCTCGGVFVLNIGPLGPILL